MSEARNKEVIASSEMVVHAGDYEEDSNTGTVAIRLGNTSLKAGSRNVRVTHESENFSVDINKTYCMRNPNRNKAVKRVLNRIDQCSLVNGWEVLWIDNSNLSSFIDSIFGKVEISDEEIALMSLWRMGGVNENVDMSAFGLEGEFKANLCGYDRRSERLTTYFPYLEIISSEPVNFDDLDATKHDISDDVYPRSFNHGLIIDLFSKIMARESPDWVEFLERIAGNVRSAIESEDLESRMMEAFDYYEGDINDASSCIIRILRMVADYCKPKHLIPYYSEIREELMSWDESNGNFSVDEDEMGVRVILYQFGIHICDLGAVLQSGEKIVCRGPKGTVENEIDNRELASLHFYTIYKHMKHGDKAERDRISKILNFQDLLYQEKTKYIGCPQLALIYRWWLKTGQSDPRPEVLKCEAKFKSTITTLLEWIRMGMELNANEKILEGKYDSIGLVERIFLEEVVFKSKMTSINSLKRRKVVVIGEDTLFYDFMNRKICVLDSRFVEQIFADERQVGIEKCRTPYELLNVNLVGRITARILVSLLYKTPHGKKLTGGLMETELEEIYLKRRIGYKVEVNLSEIVEWAEMINLKNMAEKSSFIRDMLLLLSKSGCSSDKVNNRSCYNKVVSESSHPLHTMHYDMLVPLDGMTVQSTRKIGDPRCSIGFTRSGGRKFKIVRPLRGKNKTESLWTSSEVKGRVHIMMDEGGEERDERNGWEVELVVLKGVSAGMTVGNNRKELISQNGEELTDSSRKEKRKKKLINIGVLISQSRKEIEVSKDYSQQEKYDKDIKILVEEEYGIPSDTRDPAEVFRRISICREAEDAAEERRGEIINNLNLMKSKNKNNNAVSDVVKTLSSKKEKHIGQKSEELETGKAKKNKDRSSEVTEKTGRHGENSRHAKAENVNKGRKSNKLLVEIGILIVRSRRERSEGRNLRQENTDREINELIEKEYDIPVMTKDHGEVYKRILICREAEEAVEERRKVITSEIEKRKREKPEISKKVSCVKIPRSVDVKTEKEEGEINIKLRDQVVRKTEVKVRKKGLNKKQERRRVANESPVVINSEYQTDKKEKYGELSEAVSNKASVNDTPGNVKREFVKSKENRDKSPKSDQLVRVKKLKSVEDELRRTETERNLLMIKKIMRGRMKEMIKRSRERRKDKDNQRIVKSTLRPRFMRNDPLNEENFNRRQRKIYRKVKIIKQPWKSDEYYGNRPKMK